MFSLGEDEIYVKIFTGLARERVTQVEGDQQQYSFRSNNIRSQRGPTRFDPRGVTLRRAGHHGQARKSFGSFPPWVRPIPASRPMSSGLFICLALPSTEDTPLMVSMQPRECRSKVWKASLGDFGNPSGRSAGSSRSFRAAMGDLGGPSGQRGRPRGSMEWNRDARQTLRTVWSGGHVCARP